MLFGILDKSVSCLLAVQVLSPLTPFLLRRRNSKKVDCGEVIVGCGTWGTRGLLMRSRNYILPAPVLKDLEDYRDQVQMYIIYSN